MNVSLTQELEEFVNSKVQSGMYYSASEVIHEGLRLLKEQDYLKELRRQEVRNAIAVGTEEVERGDVVDGEAYFEELRLESIERRTKSSPQ